MDWDDLRYFTKVAETGSLLAAARFLRVNVATVSRHVERLESQLGRKLFLRTQQGYRLNEEGVRVAQWAQRIQGEVDNLHALFAAKPTMPAGPVTLATTEPLSMHFVGPLLGSLHKALPGIVLDLVSDLRPVNLSRREADIVLRAGRIGDGNLLGRRIGEIGYGLYASSAYLKAHGMPRRADGFSSHRIVEWSGDVEPTEQMLWQRRIASNAVPVLRTSSGYMREAALRAGMAIALMPCLAIDDRSGMRRIDVGAGPPRTEIWLASHASLAHHPAIRAVLEFIADTAKAQRARLRGD
jgi:DNA-binding transcriptional LysR family regulator